MAMDENQDHPASHHQLLSAAQLALQQGAFEKALADFRKVYDENPGDLRAAVGLGLTIAFAGEAQRGLEMLKGLLDNYPSEAVVADAVGLVLANQGQYQEAETWFRKAIRLGGFHASTACNLGATLNELGRFDDAAAMFRRCLRQNPDDVSARYHLGLCQLLAGDFEAGWQGFYLRNRVAGRAERSVGDEIRRWTGEPLAGKSIILLAEQGLGDTIQFARFASMLADDGAEVFVLCDPALQEVLSTVRGVSRVLGTDDMLPPLDFQASLLDLPGLLGISAENIPGAEAYLQMPDRGVAGGTNLLPERVGRCRVGLVWSGNPNNKTDYKRSIPLAAFTPLLNCPEIDFYSLQIGDAARQLEDIAKEIRPLVLFENQLPLGDVAGILCELDLLISVDTSLAHLAGALGVPVWTMISYVPDWRWMLGREDTPWYTSMRLFRQTEIGSWSAPIEAVRKQLAALS